MAIVARIRSCGRAVGRFGIETVQWQRPAPSALYLMLVNSLFWSVERKTIDALASSNSIFPSGVAFSTSIEALSYVVLSE